jgi:hypothetical protein
MHAEEYIPFEHVTNLHIRCLYQYARTDGAKLSERAHDAGCRDVSHYKCELERIMGLSHIWRGKSKPEKLKMIDRFLARWDEYKAKEKLMDDPAF